MQVGDLVKNIHALYPAGLGLIIEISKPQLANPNACPYRVHWFDGPEPAWMRKSWLEILGESRRLG